MLYKLLEVVTVRKNSLIVLKQDVEVLTSEEPPFLPTASKPFTLVLDLDETLIHYIDVGEGSFLIRPGAREFLAEMSKHFEIVIFTAAMQDYADWVLD